MKRTFDLLLALIALPLIALPVILVAIAVKVTSPGPVIHWSDRVGRANRMFRMPKFRTMHVDVPQVATHLITDAERYLTPIGSFLRKSSLDELPQLWNILKGDMSFVGPRPALFNQYDLIEMRTRCGVHEATPGLTGWAQVNGRDELPIPEKVRLDMEYVLARSFLLDLKILAVTFLRVARKDGILH